MKNDENGAMFVEAAIVLPFFMIAVLSFISLISLYTVHSKMQYAITQTSNEVATYCYFYSYLGIRDVNGEIQDINNKNLGSTDKALNNMISIINTSSSVMGLLSNDADNIKNGDLSGLQNSAGIYTKNFNDIKDNGEQLANYTQSLLDDPKLIIKWVLGFCTNSAVENGKSALGSYLLYPALTYKYLGYESGNGSKDDFLKKMGISNMSFTNSSLLPEIEGSKSLNNRVIDVIVTYDYTLPFSVLPGEASTFHIVQRAVSLSWGDGDDTYKAAS